MSAADLGARALARQALAVCVALSATACAPIDRRAEVTIRPRQTPTPAPRYGDEQTAHEFVVDYVQLGARVLVELAALEQCVTTVHTPVLRVEHVERKNRGFVAWDFSLGVGAAGFAALAFARPQAFTKPLVDGQGRVVYNYNGAYVIGGLFTTLAVGLVAAGIVNAVRSRDTTHYADAFEVARGEPHPCAGAGPQSDTQPGAAVEHPLASRRLTLFVAEGVLEAEAQTDAEGRARFELPAWPAELELPASGLVPALIEVGQRDGDDVEAKVLEFELRVPFDAMTDAHTGRAQTRLSGPARSPDSAADGPQ